MKKKCIAITCIMCILLGLLSACGRQLPSTTSGTPESTVSNGEIPTVSDDAAALDEFSSAQASVQSQPESILPIADESVTYHLWTGMAPYVSGYINDFSENSVINELEKITNIHLEIQTLSNENESQAFALMISSGSWDGIDILSSVDRYYVGGANQAIQDGVLIDLRQSIADYVPNFQKTLDEDEALRKIMVTDDGYITNFPLLYDEPMADYSGFMIRKDWLDEVNMAIPETYDELHDALVAIQPAHGATMLLPAMGCTTSDGFASGFGISGKFYDMSQEFPFYVEDGIVKFGMVEEGYREFLTTLSQWYSEGLIYPEYYSASEMLASQDTSLTVDNKVSVIYDDVAMMGDYKNLSDDSDFNLAAIPDPVQEKGDINHIGFEASRFNTNLWYITSSCEDVETLCKWINYLYSEEGSLLCLYGVEGEGMEYGEDGLPQYSELITNNPDGINSKVASCMYAIGDGAPIPYYTSYIKRPVNYSQEQQEAFDIWANASDEANNYPKGAALNSTESEEAGNLMSDINTYVREMVTKFIVGQASLDDFDSFVDELNNMGVPRLVMLYQNAYDRYLEK